MNKTLGEIHDELFEIVQALHIAYMGDDRNEINEAEKAYANAQEIYGKETVAIIQKYYNEEVIAKA
jgi:predicted lipid-binding transport protein (Tim44 family)